MLRWFNSQNKKYANSVWDGLLSYYDFSDITTAAIDKFSDNNIPKRGSGALSSNIATIGASLRVGVSGFTESTYFVNSSYTPIESSFGLSCWVKFSSSLGGVWHLGYNNSIIRILDYSSYIRLAAIPGSVCDVPKTTFQEEFNFVSIYYDNDNNNTILYINGERVGSISSTYDNDTFIALGAAFNISEGLVFDFNGILSDVSIWSEFSLEKHIKLYNNGDGLFLT